jgi:hypothetical protein
MWTAWEQKYMKTLFQAVHDECVKRDLGGQEIGLVQLY